MNWRKLLRPLVLFTLILSLTSCIELVEEMHINADKSGTWELRMEAMGLQKLLGSLGTYLGEDAVSDWKKFPSNSLKRVKAIKGISDVQPSMSGDFLIGLKFKYANQKALNKALYAMANVDKKFFYPKLYKVKKHKFKKVDIGKIVYQQLSEKLETLDNTSWLEYVSYKSVYHLPSKDLELKSSKNTNYKLSNNIYSQKFSLLQLSSQDNDLGIKLKYKR